MPTFYLVLTWVVLGAIVGLLALAARFKPVAWGKAGRLWLPVLSAGAALLGGLLGFWLFGRLFSSAVALWIAVLAVSVPWLCGGLWKRMARDASAPRRSAPPA